MGERREALGNFVGVVLRIALHAWPKRRAREAGHDADAQFLGRANRGDHFLGGALAHAFGIAVAPDVIGQDALMTRLDAIAHRLTDAMVAQRRPAANR